MALICYYQIKSVDRDVVQLGRIFIEFFLTGCKDCVPAKKVDRHPLDCTYVHKGATGRELLRQGLAQGHTLTAFVRHPAKLAISHNNLRIHQGDVVDRASVESALRGQDAAISALGGATLLKRDPALPLGIHNIVTAMEQEGLRRFVYLSADTVRETREHFNPLRRAIVSLILRNTAADHQIDESMIKQSHLDWIIVRPPALTNGQRTGDYRSGERLEGKSLLPRVSRADVAEFIL